MHAPATPRIGTAGWAIPRDNAADVPGTGSHLQRYARIFRCTEINATFYRSPRPSTYARWAESTPADFRFSLKVPRAITHQSALAPTPQQVRAFLAEAQQLGPKLGPLLLQLPPKQAFAAEQARTFFSLFRDAAPAGFIALEPRHATWFTAEADALLRDFHIARVAADPAPAAAKAALANSPDALNHPPHLPGGHPALTYFRLHGSPRTYYSSYPETYLRALATTLHNLPADTEPWVIFDNTASGTALGNALSLLRSFAISF